MDLISNYSHYKLLCSAPIIQALITKRFLKEVVQLQDGVRYRLPAGPLLLSDSSLLRAFKRQEL